MWASTLGNRINLIIKSYNICIRGGRCTDLDHCVEIIKESRNSDLNRLTERHRTTVR
jgi:hypothetical protein